MGVITWQHYRVDLGLWSNIYTSKRIGRPLQTSNTSKLALYGTIPATYFRDGDVTVSIRIKNDSSRDDLKIFFRVDINSNLYYDYVSFCAIDPDLQLVINDGKWQTYSRIFSIDEHNKDKVICIGIYAEGEGGFSLADLTIDGRQATELAPQFSTALNPVMYEYTTYPKLEHIVTKDKIFDIQMNFGDVATRKLSENLYVHVPLALYGTKESTYPACQSGKFAQMQERIIFAEPKDDLLMLSDIIVAWNVIKYFSPYLSDLDVFWDNELFRAFERASEYDTYNSQPIRLMMSRLEDAHVTITAPDDVPSDKWRYLPVDIQKINDLLLVSHSFDSQIYPGDIIKCVNGTDAMDGFLYHAEMVSGGSHYKNARAKGLWLRSFGECETVKIDILRGNENMEVRATTIPRKEYIEYLIAATSSQSEWIDDTTLYINLSNTGFGEVKKLVENRRQDQVVILDIRNGTVSMLSDICSLILDSHKFIPMRQVSHIPQVIYPETPMIADPLSNVALREPDRKNIFLVGPTNYSHHEEMLDYIRYAGLGYLIGTNTGGCNGRINKITLPSGGEVNFTGTKVFSNLGQNYYYYSIGIKPDLYIENSIDDITHGIDATLNAAIKLNN